MVKIGIMGAHGCGKTSLVGQIHRDFFERGSIAIVEETAREIPHAINEQMTIEGQRWMFQEQLEREIAAGGSGLVICDRTVVDPVVYATWMADRTGDLNWQMFVDARITAMLNFYNSYDLVYWVRPDQDPGRRKAMLVDDGVRSVDPAYQADIDTLFERIIRRYKLRVVPGVDYDPDAIRVLLDGSSDNRVARVDKLGRFDVGRYLDHYKIPYRKKILQNGQVDYVLRKCLFCLDGRTWISGLCHNEQGGMGYVCYGCHKKDGWDEALKTISGDNSLAPFYEGYNPTVHHE